MAPSPSSALRRQYRNPDTETKTIPKIEISLITAADGHSETTGRRNVAVLLAAVVRLI